MPRIFDVILGRTKPVQANLDALFGLTGAQITLQASQSLVPSGRAGVCYKPVAGRSFAETASETAQLLGLDSAGAGTAPTAGGAGEPSTGNSPVPLSPTGTFHQEDDKYGYHWIVIEMNDFQELVTQVHVVNSTLQDNGFGPQLLCSVFAFRPDPAGDAGAGGGGGTTPIQLAYLIYLYKRGAFYPFVPAADGSEHRDLETELLLQNVLKEDLPIESDKERWMPLWGLPVS